MIELTEQEEATLRALAGGVNDMRDLPDGGFWLQNLAGTSPPFVAQGQWPVVTDDGHRWIAAKDSA
jgi:hypothetical protein